MISFSRFRSYDSSPAGKIVISTCEGRDPNNAFLNGYLQHLSQMMYNLELAMAEDKEKSLIAEGNRLDAGHDSCVIELRNLTGMKASIPSLGAEAASSEEIYNSLVHYGQDRDIEDLPRPRQIDAMDKFIGDYTTEEGEKVINQARVRPLFNEAVAWHTKLKEVEEAKGKERTASEAIFSVSEATAKVNPLLSSIYKHVSDYAKIGHSDYQEILKELDNKLTPIASQVKARDTRAQNSSEE